MTEIVSLKGVTHPVYFNLVERTAGFRGASRAFVAPHASKGCAVWFLTHCACPGSSFKS